MSEGGFIDNDGLIAAIKAFIAKRNLNYATMDELVGVAPGMTGKLLGDSQVRKFSIDTMFGYTQVLAMRFHVSPDPELAEQNRELWEERKGPVRNYAPKVPRIGQKTIERVRGVVLRDHCKRLSASILPEQRKANAIKAGKARWKGVRKEQRRQLMQAAADARWKAPRGVARSEHRRHGQEPGRRSGRRREKEHGS